LTINDSDYDNKYSLASEHATPFNNSNSNPFENSFKGKTKSKQSNDTESNSSKSSQLSAVSINDKLNEIESLLS
jgi:hypothetical protein